MNKQARQQARKRLDSRLASLAPLNVLPRPTRGWICAIREALGMTGVQYAKRLNISPQSVSALEQSESKGAIKLDTLMRAAAALNCRLVYALVPNEPLEQMTATRARALAMRDLARASHTMRLEDQTTTKEDAEALIKAYVQEHVRDRDLWDEP